MLKIKDEFTLNTYNYKLIKRVNNIALYVQFKRLLSDSLIMGYEIHKVRLNPERVSKFKQSDGSIVEVFFEKRESLASNTEFGQYGWSIKDKDTALEFFDNMVKKEELKVKK